jgi:hypothetical protein
MQPVVSISLDIKDASNIRLLLLGSSRSPSSLILRFLSRSCDLDRDLCRRSLGLSWSVRSCLEERVDLWLFEARSTDGSAIVEDSGALRGE